MFDHPLSLNVAHLQNLDSGVLSYLSATTLVGRSQRCQLRLNAVTVSAVHAQITWDGRRWSVRDLNSTNGTTVDGRRLAAGERAQLNPGSVLVFGTAEHRFRVQNVAAPQLMATAAASNAMPVMAKGEMLCLPAPENCELSIFRDRDGQWVAEDAAGLHSLEDQQLVLAGSRQWCISLPDAAASTREHSMRHDVPLTLHDYTMVLRTGRDREPIHAELVHEHHRHALEHRAHHQLLLELVRARLADHAQGTLPEEEQGWVYRDELLGKLGLDLSHLNIWLFRARQQVALLNIPSAGSLFERRAGTKQLRIGMSKLQVTDL